MGIGSKIKDAKRIFSQDGSFEAVNSRISNLETHEYKITYYEVVSGTSGTLTVPSQGTINADEFGLSGNAILSKIDVNGKPTFESPVTSGGSPVTASLNVLTGAWVASAAYTDTNVALIYSIKINALYYDNLVYNNIIETVKVTADVGTTTLQSVTDAGNTTTNTIETAGYVKTGGTSSQFLKADGSVDSSVYITSSALTPYLTTASAALTYYPLTNPSAYISGITSGMVTTALGFTPYNATNPSGFITSSALAPYLTTASAALTYFPIPTGTISQYLRGDGTLATFPTIPIVTPSALTKTDDTNVTLTLGGSPSTALLADTSITVGWTGTLADSRITSAATWNAKQDALSGTGFVKSTAGVISYDTNTYLTTTSAASTYVPYTGATANVDLGTHSLTASDLIIDHASGSGVAASITKGGNGEALTVVKSSGSGNVASFTGGNTFISTLTTPTINGVSGLLSFGSTDRVSVGNYATPSSQRIFTVGQDTAWITIGSLPTATSFGGIWINQSSITQNNACIYASITDVTFQAPTTLFLRAQTVNVITLKQNTFSAIPFGSGSGAVENFTFTKPTNTGQTASTSISGFVVNGGSRQWNTGNIATQSENVWGATTYSFVGASTITNAYGNVFNAPIAGTNCTITDSYAANFNGNILLSNGNRFIRSENGYLFFRSAGALIFTSPANFSLAFGMYQGTTNLQMYTEASTGAITSFKLIKPNNIGQTAATAISGWDYVGGSRTWLAGNIGTQNENVWGAVTYNFGSASTITNAYGNVFNAPIAGTNATITNNWAAKFNGQIQVTGNIINVGGQPNIGTAAAPYGTFFISNIRAGADMTFGAGYGTSGDRGLIVYGATRNVLIQNGGTFADNGFRLDVNGTGRFQNTLRVTNNLIAGFNTTPRTGIISDGVTSVLGNLQNFTTNYHSGEVLYSEVSGEALNFGQLCYRNAAGKWQKATGSSSAIAAYNMLGICLHTVGATDTAISILTRGYVESTYLSAGAVGSPLFMDATTAGSITDTAPSTAGNIVRIIGNVFWSSATQTNSKWIVYFNPDNTWIEL